MGGVGVNEGGALGLAASKAHRFIAHSYRVCRAKRMPPYTLNVRPHKTTTVHIGTFIDLRFSAFAVFQRLRRVCGLNVYDSLVSAVFSQTLLLPPRVRSRFVVERRCLVNCRPGHE